MKRIPAIASSPIGVPEKIKAPSAPFKSGFMLLFTAALLVFLGLSSISSTTYGTIGSELLVRQVVWIIVGACAFVVVYQVGYQRLIEWSPLILTGCCMLLLLARFCRPIKGAHRWIVLPGVGSIQPSEFAKLALIMFLAYYLPKHQRAFSTTLTGLIPPAAVAASVLGLVLLGKDWGTTALLGVATWLLFFAAGAQLRWMCLPIVVPPLAYFYLKAFDSERWSRLTSFLDPETFQKDDGYQLWLSILALGSGGTTGLGFTKSRMKAEYLPESHTDFILSIVGEELGYFAMAGIILAFLIFLSLAIYISIHAADKEGMLLGFGVGSVIAMQAMINIGVVCGAVPTKGMSCPFIGYGGSNIVMCLIGVGLLFSVSTTNHEKPSDAQSPSGKPPRTASTQETDLKAGGRT